MSLVNDMLRDLDRRGVGRPEDPDPRSPLDKLERRPVGHPPAWVWLLVGVLLGAGALAVVGFRSSVTSNQDLRPDRDTPGETASERVPELKPQSQTSDIEPVISPVPVAVEGQAPHQALFPTPTPTPAPDPAEDKARDAALNQLLSRAEEARARDRLTRPAHDNAYDYYQQVLAMEPGHPAARSGLTAIARRYTEMAETALDRGQLARARQLIRRGLSVKPGHPGLQHSRTRLESLASARLDEADKNAEMNPQTADAAAEPGSDTPAAKPQMQMSLDAETRDRRAARRGQELLAAGDRAAAREHLQSRLSAWSESGSSPVRITQALVDLYLSEGDYPSAEALLETSDALPKLVLHRLWAELEQARGRPGEAIDWLESELASAREDENYRSLLARLYYTQGRQDQAAQSYSRLLADFGDRPAYWLGLGLARDAQDRDSEALEAFRQLQASGAYERNREIAEYLTRRITALQRQTQVSEP